MKNWGNVDGREDKRRKTVYIYAYKVPSWIEAGYAKFYEWKVMMPWCDAIHLIIRPVFGFSNTKQVPTVPLDFCSWLLQLHDVRICRILS